MIDSLASDWPPEARRQHWLGVLARSPRDALEQALPGAGSTPEHTRLRAPETGMLMVRARAGAEGELFNLGEMTLTRAAVRLADGTVGFGFVAGRDLRHAELVALLDALLQQPGSGEVLEASLLQPLEQALRDVAAHQHRRAAETRVDFYTLATARDGAGQDGRARDGG